MGLLREVMERPLDPGYAIAAQRKAKGERSPNRLVTVILAAGIALVTVWAVTVLRAPQPDAIEARAALERQVEERSSAVEALQNRNAATRQEIAKVQAEQLQRQGGQPLVERAQRLGIVSGELPVVGEGVELRLQDAPGTGDVPVGVDPREDTDTEQGRVQDRDLQIVVNGLWASGAEAIAVNDQRLTSLSAIRSAGQAILVDFRPLVPPYVVQAVGDPSTLQLQFAKGTAGAYVQALRNNYGIEVSVASKQRLSLPGAGEVSLRWARPATPETAVPSASEVSP